MARKLVVTDSSLIDEIVAAYGCGERQPGDVDAKQMMQRWGVSRGTVVSRLNKLVERGLLASEIVVSNGREMRVWRKATSRLTGGR